MSRKPMRIKKRELAPDPIYGDRKISKFINCIMIGGKKSIAEKAVMTAFEYIKNTMNSNPKIIFDQAVENAKPLVELKPIRIGGTTYKVPIELLPNKQLSLSLKWIVDSARSRNESSIGLRLGKELVDCYKGEGITMKRREEMHKMAEANRAFSHYRW